MSSVGKEPEGGKTNEGQEPAQQPEQPQTPAPVWSKNPQPVPDDGTPADLDNSIQQELLYRRILPPTKVKGTGLHKKKRTEVPRTPSKVTSSTTRRKPRNAQ